MSVSTDVLFVVYIRTRQMKNTNQKHVQIQSYEESNWISECL